MFGLVVLSSLLIVCSLGSPPLMVQQPVESEVLFKVSLTDDRHRSFELLCEAESDGKLEYRWIKDGKELNVTSQSERIARKPESGTLKFIKPSEDDEGVYYCLAENADGTARSNAVTLKKTFLGNFVNDSVRVVEAHEGAPLKLECDAPSGYPTPSIFWIIQTVHGAIKGVDNSRVTLDPVGNLWFSSVTREDASKDSNYVCSAASASVNEYKLGNRITLKVTPRANKTWESRPPTLQYASPEDVVVLKGKKVEIFCVYSGDPLPEIAWSKDGHTVWKSERVVRENHGKSLKIKNADAADAGKYKCEASSELGDTKTSTFNLRVESPPQFVTEPESQNNITVGESFEVECVVEGVPAPMIVWHFNGKAIGAGKQSRWEIAEGKITVKSAEASDKGNFACTTANAHGYASRNFFVDVHDSTE